MYGGSQAETTNDCGQAVQRSAISKETPACTPQELETAFDKSGPEVLETFQMVVYCIFPFRFDIISMKSVELRFVEKVYSEQ